MRDKQHGIDCTQLNEKLNSADADQAERPAEVGMPVPYVCVWLEKNLV